MNKLVWIVAIVGLLVGCGLFSLTLALRFVPPEPGTRAVALADLDGDGDLDAFFAKSFHGDQDCEIVQNDPNEVWLNDGSGAFTNS